ncbi:hypothetical protein COT72_01475 [archaeon CG10_big_fil_rev_8_21_14_0_10_43_11]|nr:MAG: hypothetical protein COT72_01475 [archaeon CG10_big_fil_rev_8_21_14_0_10_43_11]
MDVEIAKKFGLIEVTCFHAKQVSIVIKHPDEHITIFLPDIETETKNAYSNYESVYGSVYGPYSAYSSYSSYASFRTQSRVIRRGNAHFITFEPDVAGVYEIEVFADKQYQILRIEA